MDMAVDGAPGNEERTGMAITAPGYVERPGMVIKEEENHGD